MRARLVLGVAVAALVAAGPAAAAHRFVERGIVQSVGAQELVLRALDGSTLAVPVGPSTSVRVNGRAATLDDVEAGFVAAAVLPRSGSGPALAVRAVGRVEERVERGRLVGVGRSVVVLDRPGRTRLRIPLDRATVVRRHGRAMPRLALRRGMRVTVRLAVDGSAVRIAIRGDGRG